MSPPLGLVPRPQAALWSATLRKPRIRHRSSGVKAAASRSPETTTATGGQITPAGGPAREPGGYFAAATEVTLHPSSAIPPTSQFPATTTGTGKQISPSGGPVRELGGYFSAVARPKLRRSSAIPKTSRPRETTTEPRTPISHLSGPDRQPVQNLP